MVYYIILFVRQEMSARQAGALRGLGELLRIILAADPNVGEVETSLVTRIEILFLQLEPSNELDYIWRLLNACTSSSGARISTRDLQKYVMVNNVG